MSDEQATKTENELPIYMFGTREERIAFIKTFYELVLEWRKRGGRYLFFADYENDPLGKKYYTSSGMTYVNCASELEELLKDQVSVSPIESRVLSKSQLPSPRLYPK